MGIEDADRVTKEGACGLAHEGFRVLEAEEHGCGGVTWALVAYDLDAEVDGCAPERAGVRALEQVEHALVLHEVTRGISGASHRFCMRGNLISHL
jgi:hypothetical protein